MVERAGVDAGLGFKSSLFESDAGSSGVQPKLHIEPKVRAATSLSGTPAGETLARLAKQHWVLVEGPAPGAATSWADAACRS